MGSVRDLTNGRSDTSDIGGSGGGVTSTGMVIVDMGSFLASSLDGGRVAAHAEDGESPGRSSSASAFFILAREARGNGEEVECFVDVFFVFVVIAPFEDFDCEA